MSRYFISKNLGESYHFKNANFLNFNFKVTFLKCSMGKDVTTEQGEVCRNKFFILVMLNLQWKAWVQGNLGEVRNFGLEMKVPRRD